MRAHSAIEKKIKARLALISIKATIVCLAQNLFLCQLYFIDIIQSILDQTSKVKQ